MATATVKRQKIRPQVKRTAPKKLTKGLVGNILADFAATAVFVFASSTFGEVGQTIESWLGHMLMSLYMFRPHATNISKISHRQP